MYSNDKGNYDVIGDIHGHVTHLELLLKKLSYTKSPEGVYSHPTRKVIFLGDFVDGGSAHQKVIDIVKPMVENKTAYAIMGNHEFNAISFHTAHPDSGLPLREHTIKNVGQHIQFLSEYKKDKKDKKQMLAAIEWFKTLPLFIDLPEVRAVHACWSEYEMKKIKPYLTIDNRVKSELFIEFYVKANTKGSAEFNAVEVLLKGVEVALPEHSSFKDQYGNVRHETRIRWWLVNAKTYGDYSLAPLSEKLSAYSFPRDKIENYLYDVDQKPVFIGHYWLSGKPAIQQANIACLDYSVGESNNQVAYQWSKGDKQLFNRNFVCSVND